MIKGRRSNVKMKELGEAVLFRIPETKTMPGKFEPKWEEGVYVGFNIRTGEDLVSTDRGVFRVSTVRRRPANERWSKVLLDGIVGTPAIPVPGAQNRKMPAYAKKFARDGQGKPDPSFVPQPEPDTTVRTWKIMKADIETHGPSPGCPGCRAVTRQVAYKAQHTPACRARFER
jgi:hypothetical protein